MTASLFLGHEFLTMPLPTAYHFTVRHSVRAPPLLTPANRRVELPRMHHRRTPQNPLPIRSRLGRIPTAPSTLPGAGHARTPTSSLTKPLHPRYRCPPSLPLLTRPLRRRTRPKNLGLKAPALIADERASTVFANPVAAVFSFSYCFPLRPMQPCERASSPRTVIWAELNTALYISWARPGRCPPRSTGDRLHSRMALF
jgi:hypothetical protein